ncbi:MAG: PIN domain-containing protein [Candidatus Aenigmarchaeota archaeon]|nr:PIN domain-containing protein [Candidatus Aenigmarchaeota archaeon]
MDLVLDANVLFAALIRDSHTRHLILSSSWTFYIPEFLFEELMNNLDVITEKTGLSEEKVRDLFTELMIRASITSVPSSEFIEYFEQAESVCPDPDDVHYFALALKLRCAIWSNDKKLKEQNIIKVYATKELSEPK